MRTGTPFCGQRHCFCPDWTRLRYRDPPRQKTLFRAFSLCGGRAREARPPQPRRCIERQGRVHTETNRTQSARARNQDLLIVARCCKMGEK